MASLKARKARAAKYARMLEQRQSSLTDHALMRDSPFVIVRTIELFCSRYGRLRRHQLMGPVRRHSLRNAVREVDCDGTHTFGKREWCVVADYGRKPTSSFNILERFNCFLMAKALRDDLNTKAAVAIMKRESEHADASP